MSSATLGFFVGAIPGIALIVRNMIRFQRVISKAQDVAQAKVALFDFSLSYSQQFDFLLRPRCFIQPRDGPGLIGAKECLLSVRKKTLVRHAFGGLVLFLGALVCSVLATSLWPGH